MELLAYHLCQRQHYTAQGTSSLGRSVVPIPNPVQIIGVILAPVTMITSCALLISSLQQRYVNMGDRLRAMHRERFDLFLGSHDGGVATAQHDSFVTERLCELAVQVPRILRRHRLIRDAMLFEYVAIGFYMVNMGVLAWLELGSLPSASLLSLALFLVGTIILFGGVIITILEAWQSHNEIAYEMRQGEFIIQRWQADDAQWREPFPP